MLATPQGQKTPPCACFPPSLAGTHRAGKKEADLNIFPFFSSSVWLPNALEYLWIPSTLESQNSARNQPTTWKITGASSALYLSYKTKLSPQYLFKFVSRSSFPLISPTPCPKPFNMRCNPKPSRRRESQKQTSGWWEASYLIFPANRKVKYLTLPFGSFFLFLCLYKTLLRGEEAKRRKSIVFLSTETFSKMVPCSAGAQMFFSNASGRRAQKLSRTLLYLVR